MDVLPRKLVHTISGRFFQALPLSLGSGLKLSTEPLARDAETFFLRRDAANPHLQVNVFDTRGNVVLTIVRERRTSSKWFVYEQPGQTEVARIQAGLGQRSVRTRQGGTLRMVTNRGVRGKLHRHYYTHDGALYEWSRRSNYLERVVNPGGGYEELRSRVALVRVLRPHRFDWELVVDISKVELLDAVGSAFVMMKTQWLDNVTSTAPSYRVVQGAKVPDAWDHDGLLMYKPQAQPLEPRDFFNPPK